MKPHKRPYQYTQITDGFDTKTTFVTIDAGGWKRPYALSLENLKGVLKVNVNEDLEERNVTSVEYKGQEENPLLPPNTLRVNTRTHIAVDDNYLYVWIPSLKRWKRTLLSGW